MYSTELAARRAVDHCRNSLKSVNSLELLEETSVNPNSNNRYAGACLSELREQLRNEVKTWLATRKRIGFLAQIPDKVLENLTIRHGFFQDLRIPTLDMTGLRENSPQIRSGSTDTPRTPKAVDIHLFEDLEVVEVTDSSAEESQLLQGKIDLIPTVSAKNLDPGMKISENIDFCKLDINFIPSFPLKSSLKVTAVQTRQETEVVETTDTGTSYNLNVEESVSTESDPSFGQIAARVDEKKLVIVSSDGSLLSKQKPVEDLWKTPMELVRIAEQNISSSFGSDDNESVSAKRASGRKHQASHSDDEATVNQVSQLDSELSN